MTDIGMLWNTYFATRVREMTHVQQDRYQWGVKGPSLPTQLKICILALEAYQSPVTKKFKVMPPGEQAIMSSFQKSSPTINATPYCLVQCTLKDFICRRQPGSWIENYCSLLTMAEPMQHMHSRKQFGNSNGNSLITCPTAQTLPWVIFTSLVHW